MNRLRADQYTGLRFGRLEVLSPNAFERRKGWTVHCRCDCGENKSVRLKNLKSGKTSSCGCLNRDVVRQCSVKHGMSKRPIHNLWASMMARCYSKNSQAFRNYGARGISVENRWHKFEKFYSDMGDRPEGMSLDRIDNDGPYSRTNCQWADRKSQNRNRRDSRRFTINGQTRGLAEWCEIYGQDYKRVYQRVFRGDWPILSALSCSVYPKP